ncbi:MAG: SDR family oxidoreductase [Xenococcus sp. (in: cyanobacteria)]
MLTQSDLILVAGATGGVGQLVVAKLLEKKLSVRVLSRNRSQAEKMFDNQVDIVVGDLRYPDTLTSATKDVTHIICCTGTTAFPSQRWDFVNLFDPKNTPQAVDGEGVKNLILASPSSLKRFVFVSSCGVLRKDNFPFKILNTFGVLNAKLYGEKALEQSGLPYTILRPGRLIDGPYTSYDLNTLLRAKTDGKKAVIIGTGDTLNGETSRIDVANVCIECLNYDLTINQALDIINSGPRPELIDWQKLFQGIS